MVPRPGTPSLDDIRSWRLWFLVPVALLAVLFLSSCYTFGDESSWIRVQNMGQEEASFTLQFFDDGGQLIGGHVCPSKECPALAPGAGLTIPLEGVSSLPEGVLGSTVVTSDQPLALLMVSDVDRDDDRYQSAGDTLSTAPSGGLLYLPLMMRKAGAGEDWNGRFAVQNVGTTAVACVTLVYVSDQDGAVYWDPYEPARPPEERLGGCPNGGFPIQPGASAFRDVATLLPPSPFQGAVRIELHTNGQGLSPSLQTVEASAGVWNENSMHFGSYRALREAEVGNTVLLPLIEREAFGFWSTRVHIQSADPNVTAAIDMRIQGWDLSQDPPQAVSRRGTFAVRGARLCAQDDAAGDCLAPGDDLPPNFTGHAVLTSSRPISVVVSRAIPVRDWFATYRGVAMEQATTKIYLPLVLKNAESPNRTGQHSALHILTADGGSAEVTITYRGPGIPEDEAVTQVITVSGAATVEPDRFPGLPDGFVGSAVLESDRPIVAVGGVLTGDFTGDTLVMYNGVPGP